MADDVPVVEAPETEPPVAARLWAKTRDLAIVRVGMVAAILLLLFAVFAAVTRAARWITSGVANESLFGTSLRSEPRMIFLRGQTRAIDSMLGQRKRGRRLNRFPQS